MSSIIDKLTFYDGENPQVLAALEEPGSIYDKINPHVEPPWYYIFNHFFPLILTIHLQECFGI